MRNPFAAAEFDPAMQFKDACDLDLKRRLGSPVIATRETSKAIDLSGIMRLTGDEIDELLRQETNHAA